MANLNDMIPAASAWTKNVRIIKLKRIDTELFMQIFDLIHYGNGVSASPIATIRKLFKT
jgi:hypothetical protein